MARRKTSETYHVIFTVFTENGKITHGLAQVFEGSLKTAVAYCRNIDEQYSDSTQYALAVSKIARSCRKREDAYNGMKNFADEITKKGV